MSRPKATWMARWQQIGTRMVRGGDQSVYLTLVIDAPEPVSGRPVEVDLTPEMARHLADRLYRNADEAEERSR